jgi:hypothetical protein
VAIPERVGARTSQINGISFAFSQFVVFAAYALSYWYGGLLVKRGQASFKDVLQVRVQVFTGFGSCFLGLCSGI